ncbi:MAG: AsmA family protein [bacterium]|nr:AsmA family protein [bacterium]
MKIINIKGISIILIALLMLHFAVGLIISPAAGKFIVKTINENSGAKISIGKISVWPLTLSCSFADIKIFNPENEAERIIYIPKASLRLSPLAMLAKRLTVSELKMSGSEINLKGEPDGSFNIQHIAKKPEAAEKTPAAEQLKGRKDLFSGIYDKIKQRSSDKKAAAQKEKSKAVTREVTPLPKGRFVTFQKPSDQYLLEIRSAHIHSAYLHLEDAAKQSVDFKRAEIKAGGIGIDTVNGIIFNELKLKGAVNKNGVDAGKLTLHYRQSGSDKTDMVLKANEIDIPSVSFIFSDSLPVNINEGKLDIDSETKITGISLYSENSLKLSGHKVSPRGGADTAVNMIPLPIICDAVNQVNPVEMKFKITGTADRPEFKGFEESLLKIIKPYLSNVTEDLKKQGEDYLKNLFDKKSVPAAPASQEESSTQDVKEDTVNKLKSLFK